MTFWRWLAVTIRIAAEAVLLGFAWHRSHLSVALLLTGLTANMEWQQFRKHLERVEEDSLSEKGKMLQRLRSL